MILKHGVLQVILSASEVLQRRLNAVDKVLKQDNLSPCAKKYWKGVKKKLQFEHETRMVYGHVPPFDTVH